ncbi:hypothetical protein EYC84_001832 [Monilinia fructicola]|uniref:Uncharacterized protein n=1 Tax=Monilinia fructicola TaxID=38448 RepID=A0A5M9JQU5_MONFR|nr:hypothetical protein EYC84_001832 [Monilinia fructicola]
MTDLTKIKVPSQDLCTGTPAQCVYDAMLSWRQEKKRKQENSAQSPIYIGDQQPSHPPHHGRSSLFSPFLYIFNTENILTLIMREHALMNPDQTSTFQYRTHVGRLSSSWIDSGIEGSGLLSLRS